MRWIALLIVLSGCAQDKLIVKVEGKPLANEVTVSATWEITR